MISPKSVKIVQLCSPILNQVQTLNDKTKPPPIWGWVQDRLYDTVFHVGDSTQEFLWSVAYGTDTDRSQAYQHRQLNRQERKGELPLTQEERLIFTEILKRYEGEKLLDYWKRQKALLNYPDKHALIEQHRQKQKAVDDIKKQQETIHTRQQIARLEEQFRAIVTTKHHASNHQHRSHGSGQN